LDCAQARYFSSGLGRFYSVDPLNRSGRKANPQTINRYAYVLNNPLKLTDRTGLQSCGHVGEEPCKGKDGQPNFKVEIKTKKPWYKRAWNWLTKQASPTAKAQTTEPEELDKDEEEYKKEEVRNAFGDPADNEPKEVKPLSSFEKHDLFNFLRNQGLDPDCIAPDPEPEPPADIMPEMGIPTPQLPAVPSEVDEIIDYILSHNGSPAPGYKRGARLEERWAQRKRDTAIV
jgi:hypothetical protein